MTARVFMPQEPMKMIDRVWVPSHDTRKLFDFGEVIVCAPPGRMIFSTAPIVMSMKEKLTDFTDDDFIVGIGDPSLLGIICALAAHYNRGKFKILKWDKEIKRYIPVQVDLFQKLGQLEEGGN